MQITSTANPRIKEIRKLRNRKERDSQGLFLVEGVRLVAEAVQQKAAIQEVLYAPELLRSEFGYSIVKQAEAVGMPIIECSKDVFESIANKDNPQGLAATVQQHWLTLDTIKPFPNDIWVILDTVRDPGNLGTILRTLDAVNGSGVILLDDTCDPFDPTCIRASMGAMFTRKVVRTSLVSFAAWKQKAGIAVVGTSDHEGRVYYRNYQYSAPTFLMMGSERAGLSEDHMQICDGMVMIPMTGSCDSLNLSIATGIILYEIYHQFHGETVQ